jgi:hypothetical protein
VAPSKRSKKRNVVSSFLGLHLIHFLRVSSRIVGDWNLGSRAVRKAVYVVTQSGRIRGSASKS